MRGRVWLGVLMAVVMLFAGAEEGRCAGGESWSWQEGQPTGVIVALPPGGEIAVQVSTGRWREVHRPLPDPEPGRPLLRRIDLGVMRGVPLQRLEIHPYRLTPRGTIEALDRLTVTLEMPSAPPVVPSGDPLLEALRRIVLDPAWVQPRPPHARSRTVAQATISPTLQFSLSERAIYALPLTALASLTTSVDPAEVHFAHGDGQPLTATYDAASAQFLLYADPQPTRWAAYETYRVLYGGAAPRITARDGSPGALPAGQLFTTVAAEENLFYLSAYRHAHNGDHWYWHRLAAPGSAEEATFTAFLALDTPQTTAAPASLTLWLQGETIGEHHLTVSFAGHSAGEVVWSGQVATQSVLSIPAAWLQAGQNAVTLHLQQPTNDIDGLWVDRVTLRYPIAAAHGALLVEGEAAPHAYTLPGWTGEPLIWDVTEADDPHPLTGTLFSGGGLRFGDGAQGGRRYFITEATVRVPSSLQPLQTMSEPATADYIAVLPADWEPTLQPLLDRRAAEGMTVFAAPLQAIYDGYGDGRPSPEAIRAFVQHAYHEWSAPPSYLLLVGDGTYDPLHYTHNPTANILPPYLAYFDPWLGEAAADNRYVTVDGDDRLPDLSVGRLPANDTDELAAMVAKIIGYAVDDPAPGEWPIRHVFVADDRDAASNFPADAAAVADNDLPPTHTLTFLRCEDEDPYASDCLNVAELRQQLLATWNSGALVLNWVGHSSQQQWEHARLFHLDDLPQLHNAGRLPVVIEMTCFTGDFAQPSPLMRGMAESLVRLPQGGAVADWAVSGGGVGADHTELHHAFYNAAFGGGPWLPPGVAATAAKVAVGGGLIDYLLDGFHFFGDPAMPWQTAMRPWEAHLYLPMVMRGR